VVLGDVDRALSGLRACASRAILAKPIRPPTVPGGTSRIRFAVTAAHTEAHIDAALAALRAC